MSVAEPAGRNKSRRFSGVLDGFWGFLGII
jgi:hypothetical protein